MSARTLLTGLLVPALVCLAALFSGEALAAGPDVSFEFRPHCDTTAVEICPEFPVRDPLSRQTDILKVGDTLDMDLILHNPSALDLKRFRVWIGYDSTVLEGVALEISDAFPVETPGEADFSIADNYIKITGAAETPVVVTQLVVARIRMKVTAAPSIGTALSFYDASGTKESHTAAFTGTTPDETNVASTVQGILAIRLETAASSSSSSIAASSASSTGSALSSVAPPPVVPPAATLFSSLQPQGLRVTTEGSSVFLAWNALPSAELAGYNLYYGAVSGRYLQRRSVDQASTTLTIRALTVGTTTYFAVRGVNAAGQETDYSQEVAVTVGNPRTSTSPLSGSFTDGPQGNPPKTGGSVAGESGPATWFLLLAAASAVMGTLLAARRQWTASAVTPLR